MIIRSLPCQIWETLEAMSDAQKVSALNYLYGALLIGLPYSSAACGFTPAQQKDLDERFLRALEFGVKGNPK